MKLSSAAASGWNELRNNGFAQPRSWARAASRRSLLQGGAAVDDMLGARPLISRWFPIDRLSMMRKIGAWMKVKKKLEEK